MHAKDLESSDEIIFFKLGKVKLIQKLTPNLFKGDSNNCGRGSTFSLSSRLNNNEITTLEANGVFKSLSQLKKM